MIFRSTHAAIAQPMTSATLANALPDQATPASRKPPPRYGELDAMRGIAALIVIFHHFRMMWVGDATLSGWRKDLDLLTRPFTGGHEAVMLFFILSGFVLSVPYLRGKGQGYLRFLVRRILRIYAPYLCALALAIAGDAIWHGPHGHGSWANLTWSQPITRKLVVNHILFIGNYPWDQFNTAFWSLVIEMRLSIGFPLLFAAVLWMRNTASLIAALCLCFGGGLLLRTHGGWEHWIFTVQIAGVFIAGILLAKNIDRVSAWCRTLGWGPRSLLATAAICCYFGGEHISHKAGDLWGTDVFFVTLGAGGLMVLAISVPAASRALHTRIPRFLGRISYSLYLVHGTVLFALTAGVAGRLSAEAQFPIYVVFSLLLATLFCVAIEEPFMHLSRRAGRWHLAPARPAPRPTDSASQ